MDQSFPTNFASVTNPLVEAPVLHPCLKASKQQSGPQNPHLSWILVIVCDMCWRFWQKKNMILTQLSWGPSVDIQVVFNKKNGKQESIEEIEIHQEAKEPNSGSANL